jgi:hypothetical protein
MERYSNFTLDVIAAHISEGKKKAHLKVLRSRFLPGEYLDLFKKNQKAYEEAVTPVAQSEKLKEAFPHLTDEDIKNIARAEAQMRQFVQFVASERGIFAGSIEIPQGTDTWVVNKTFRLPGLEINPNSSAARKGIPFIDWTNKDQIEDLFVSIPFPPQFGLNVDYEGGLVQWFLDNNKFRDELKGIALQSLDYDNLFDLYMSIGPSKKLLNRMLEETGVIVQEETPAYQVLKITTPQAAHKFCYTYNYLEWCVKDEGWAKKYLNFSPLYFIKITLQDDSENSLFAAFMFSPAFFELKDEDNDDAPLTQQSQADTFILNKVEEYAEQGVEALKRDLNDLDDVWDLLSPLWEFAGKPSYWKPFELIKHEIPESLPSLIKIGYLELDENNLVYIIDEFITGAPGQVETIFDAIFSEWENQGRPVPWKPFQALLDKLEHNNPLTDRSLSALFRHYASQLSEDDFLPSAPLIRGASALDLVEWADENPDILEANLPWIANNLKGIDLHVVLSSLVDVAYSNLVIGPSKSAAKELAFKLLEHNQKEVSFYTYKLLKEEHPHPSSWVNMFLKDLEELYPQEYMFSLLAAQGELPDDLSQDDYLGLLEMIKNSPLGFPFDIKKMQVLISKAGEIFDDETFAFLLENDLSKISVQKTYALVKNIQNDDGSPGATLFRTEEWPSVDLAPGSYIAKGVSFLNADTKLSGKIIIRSSDVLFDTCDLAGSVEIGEDCRIRCEDLELMNVVVEDGCALKLLDYSLYDTNILSDTNIVAKNTSLTSHFAIHNSTIKCPHLKLTGRTGIRDSELYFSKPSHLAQCLISGSVLDVREATITFAEIIQSSFENVDKMFTPKMEIKRSSFTNVVEVRGSTEGGSNFVYDCSFSDYVVVVLPSETGLGIFNLEAQGYGSSFFADPTSYERPLSHQKTKERIYVKGDVT